MIYLIAHIAIFLVIAQFLGLLLGWLIWGFAARQRAKEIQILHERISEMNYAPARLPLPNESSLALPESLKVLIEGTLPSAEGIAVPAPPPEALKPAAPLQPNPIAPDLEDEVRQSKIEHLEKQLRELEGIRNRLPILQRDLDEAIAAKRSAESKLQDSNTNFDARSKGLLAQIRDHEEAAKEWDLKRETLEKDLLAREKELASVKAQLRDFQNNQRPQTAEPAVSEAAQQLAALKLEHQRVSKERDSIAAELELAKQGQPTPAADLQEAIRAKDAALQEQVSRIESLLWRVAELEPFAATAPQLEEDLKRQESEIAGHLAMHAENQERIRTLEQQAAAAGQHTQALSDAQSRISELESSLAKLSALEKTLAERDAENRGLLAAHADMQREMQNWKDYSAQLQPLVSKLPSLESTLSDREAEVERLKKAHAEHESRLKALQQDHAQLTQQIDEHQQRLAQLEPLAAKLPDAEQRLTQQKLDAAAKLQSLEEKHQTEITQLKVNSAQRLRKLRQSITNFKA